MQLSHRQSRKMIVSSKRSGPLTFICTLLRAPRGSLRLHRRESLSHGRAIDRRSLLSRELGSQVCASIALSVRETSQEVVSVWGPCTEEHTKSIAMLKANI